MVKPLAPSQCPNCNNENTFSVLENRIECRHCGYVLRTTNGERVTPKDEIQPPRYQPSNPLLRSSFRITHQGEIDPWARAAFDTGQDHVRREEWEEAVQAFTRSIDYQPDFIDGHLWIARIVTDPVVKRDHLTTILAHQPNHMEAIRELMILDGKLSASTANMNEYSEPELRDAGGAVGTQTKKLCCPQCGSPSLTTNDLTGLIVCNACGYSLEKPSGSVNQGMLTMALLERRSQPVQWVVGERLLVCDSCGAERTIPAHKLSDSCPFCGSKHVIERDVLGSFQQPDGLIPFMIGQKQAGERIQEILGGWTERIKGWFDNNRVDRATIEAIYLPFWVFDTVLEVRRTTTRYSGGGMDTRRSIPKDLYQSITIPDVLNNVQVCAVKSPAPMLTRQLGQYEMRAMTPYEPAMLAKYPAEIYSIDFDQASLLARESIGQRMREKHTMQVSTGTESIITTSVQSMTFQLVLMPVWVATLYEEDGDVRTSLVNGQSGRVAMGKTQRPHV